MMLVDEGKVKLDDPVEKYLARVPRPMAGGRAGRQTTCCSKAEAPDHRPRRSSATPADLPFKSAMEEPTLDLLPLADACAATR